MHLISCVRGHCRLCHIPGHHACPPVLYTVIQSGQYTCTFHPVGCGLSGELMSAWESSAWVHVEDPRYGHRCQTSGKITVALGYKWDGWLNGIDVLVEWLDLHGLMGGELTCRPHTSSKAGAAVCSHRLKVLFPPIPPLITRFTTMSDTALWLLALS